MLPKEEPMLRKEKEGDNKPEKGHSVKDKYKEK